jgi:L-lactate dehydrogenase complex protein LldG
MSARDRILGRVREALASRSTTAHPGHFESWGLVERPSGAAAPVADAPATGAPAGRFASAFTSAGGEVARVSGRAGAAAWLEEIAAGFPSLVVGERVPEDLAPARPRARAHAAALGISWASGAAAESGTIILDSSDGRRAQLLAPVHVVVLREETIRWTLAEALSGLRDDLPSAVGLHSGPSKSADIGQVMVRGVHGPARIIALLLGRET